MTITEPLTMYTKPMTRDQAEEVQAIAVEMSGWWWPIGVGLCPVPSGSVVVGFAITSDYPETLSEFVFRLADAGMALAASEIAWAVANA